MWRPPLNFITLHYAYILCMGILGLITLYPYGNLSAVDAYFFGVSATTESGLNPVDVKTLKTYQQIVIYFLPIVTNLGFINIVVVIVRLRWFQKRLDSIAPTLLRSSLTKQNVHEPKDLEANLAQLRDKSGIDLNTSPAIIRKDPQRSLAINTIRADTDNTIYTGVNDHSKQDDQSKHISFDTTARRDPKALYIPSPREIEQGQHVRELGEASNNDEDDEITKAASQHDETSGIRLRKLRGGTRSDATSMERVASSMFVLGASPSTARSRSKPRRSSVSLQLTMPALSSQATLSRNSSFRGLTKDDRDVLGGLEYRALKLLLKIVIGYFFGLHLFGAIILVGWIHTCTPKYRVYLASQGQDFTWWGFYSAQTMVDNLGLTLTPDSMVTFNDARWPMIFMSFLAFAGNTCYPCLLRFVIWVMYRLTPQESAMKESLQFLLQHPRRCYTLLFPSRPTWILFGILFALNFVDLVLIIVLDLHNPIVSGLPAGPRVAAAIFQAASSRHTGTSSFNLADVNPAVQFSLLVMMYISIYPIAIAVRASNTYEEKALGVYSTESDVDEENGASYVTRHIQNQLSFDLWYIFLGVFCITAAEANRITDDKDPAFAVFPILFEVVSAYGNVGLSLGHPSNLTSLSGHFTAFSKLVICAMMFRGRHRGLPYQIDRAIMLPSERDDETGGPPDVIEATNVGQGKAQ